MLQDLADLGPALDDSQQAALTTALDHRVALIQGPPGTGKTFVGVNLCELVLKHSTEKILCVCYTNHALDQFLEALLNKGITDVVRIGSRSRSKQLEQYNLRELASKSRAQSLNPAELRRMAVVYRSIESTEKRLQQLADMLTTTAGPLVISSDGRVYSQAAGSPGRSSSTGIAAAATKANQAWQQRNKELLEEQEKASKARQQAAASRRQGSTPAKRPYSTIQDQQQQEEGPSFDEWVDAVGPFLESEQPSVWEQLLVPPEMTGTAQNYLWTSWLKGFRNKGTVDRFKMATAAQAAAAASGGWQQAKHNKLAPLPNAEPSAAVKAAAAELAAHKHLDLEEPAVLDVLFADIWSLPSPVRYYLAGHWRGQVRSHWSKEIDDLMQKASKLQQELKALHDSSYEAVLQNARVIGCTTTGAALQKDLLGRTAPG